MSERVLTAIIWAVTVLICWSMMMYAVHEKSVDVSIGAKQIEVR